VTQVLLVRHGQASWDAEDYDVLSGLGAEQARVTGTALAERGVRPDVLVHGGLRRQRDSARHLLAGAGWDVEVAEPDPGWDEMDHRAVLDRQPYAFAGDRPTRQEFQAWFEAATLRWTGGEHDHDYDEPFPDFGARVVGALEQVVAALPDSGTAVVVTSGGPIAWLAAHLLDGGAPAHVRLAPVVVNASVTKVVVGRRGRTLVSFNDHGHLEARDGLLTYR
jgi:broad specificity phosphatase PhoE